MSRLQDLGQKIDAREARIGIIGLGYVGLPLAIEFANLFASANTWSDSTTRFTNPIRKASSAVMMLPVKSISAARA